MSNTISHFRNADQITAIRLSLANSTKTSLFSADANELRDVTDLIAINTTGSAITLEIYRNDGTNSDQIHEVSVPANSGIVALTNAVDLLQDTTYKIPGARQDPFGNNFLRIAKAHYLEVVGANGLKLIGLIESFKA